MDYQTLTYRRDDRVAFITLNRPERLNAMNMRSGLAKGECVNRLALAR